MELKEKFVNYTYLNPFDKEKNKTKVKIGIGELELKIGNDKLITRENKKLFEKCEEQWVNL